VGETKLLQICAAPRIGDFKGRMQMETRRGESESPSCCGVQEVLVAASKERGAS
jgi:hypothetical protein